MMMRGGALCAQHEKEGGSNNAMAVKELGTPTFKHLTAAGLPRCRKNSKRIE